MELPESKFSRYRSVRRAPVETQQSPPQTEEPACDPVHRSRSRYHNTEKRANRSNELSSSPDPQSPQLVPSHSVHANHRQYEPAQKGQPIPNSSDRQLSPRAEADRVKRLESNAIGRRDTRTREHHNSGHEALKHVPGERRDSPMLAQPLVKPVVDEKPRSADIAAGVTRRDVVKHHDADDAPGGCFGLFKRKRAQQSSAKQEKGAAAKALDTSKKGPAYIKQGGGGIVPGIDAPVSAVNAGSRVCPSCLCGVKANTKISSVSSSVATHRL